MNPLTLNAQLAALETLMEAIHDDDVPKHTRAKLERAISEIADARCVLSIQRQLDERRTGVVTVREIVAQAMD